MFKICPVSASALPEADSHNILYTAVVSAPLISMQPFWT